MIKINGNTYIASKILRTPKEHKLGYQFLDIEDLSGPNDCLVFVFEDHDMHDGRMFHMNNCDSFDIKLYALDIDKNLIDSFTMTKSSKNSYLIKNSRLCKYVIEVPILE